jgi:DNA-binding NarL/FixJ family response regulator
MRVLVCDRLSIVQHGMSAILEQEEDIEAVYVTGSGIEAMIIVRQLRPHVVVTGLNLDGISGLELVRRINEETLEPQPRFVVLSMLDNEETMTRVLHAGVNGLLAQEVSREELGMAVRTAATGGMALAPQVATRLVNWFLKLVPPVQAPVRGVLDSLTARERQVITLVAKGRSVEEVAAELFIGTTTVRTHIYRVRAKLGMKDRAQLVSFAYQYGLVSGGQVNWELPADDALVSSPPRRIALVRPRDGRNERLRVVGGRSSNVQVVAALGSL